MSGNFVASGVVNMYFIFQAFLWEPSFLSPQQSDVVEVNFILRLSTGLALESSVLRPLKKGWFGWLKTESYPVACTLLGWLKTESYPAACTILDSQPCISLPSAKMIGMSHHHS